MIAKVTYKDKFSSKEGTCSLTKANLTEKEVIEFFGLDKPDVEWYKIEIEK